MAYLFFLTVIGFSISLAVFYGLSLRMAAPAGFQPEEVERFGAFGAVVAFAVTGPVLLGGQALSDAALAPLRRAGTGLLALVWALDLGLVVSLSATRLGLI